MDQNILNGYVSDSKHLIQSFESIDSSLLLSHIREHLPERPSHIADIGAGTGRDAQWLVSQGHRVLAVEPVEEFRRAGKSLHPNEKIEWLDDYLPSLLEVRRRNEKFDFVLLAAVWHHLDDEERKASLENLKSIIKERGRIAISLRNGPGAGNRKCYPIHLEDTIRLVIQNDLNLLCCREAPSVQKNNQIAGVTWTWMVLENADGAVNSQENHAEY